MTTTVEYKGRELIFKEQPTDKEIEEKYEYLYGATETTFTASRSPSLEREEGPYGPDPLEGRTVAVRTAPESALAEPVFDALEELGADVVAPERGTRSDDGSEFEGVFDNSVDWEYGAEDNPECEALVLDGSVLERVSDLKIAYRFMRRGIDALGRCGRILILRRPPEEVDTAAHGATQVGLRSMTQGLAKEFGNQNGTTANMLTVRTDSTRRLYRPLSYFLADRSAYVTAQPLPLGDEVEFPPSGTVDSAILDGKTAVITGATRGIGRATAAQFAQEGARVVCIGRPGSDGLEDIEDDFGGIPLGLDVSSSDAPQRIADVAREHGGIDILVHNAGVAKAEEFIGDLDRELWREIRKINLDPAVEITDHLVEHDLLNDWGRVLCTSSVNGIAGADRVSYSATKAGVIGFAQECAESLADRGITANAVVPGVIRTDLYDTVPLNMREIFGRVNALVQPGFPSDVANAFTFLATPGAQGITGRTLRVCGGFIIGA